MRRGSVLAVCALAVVLLIAGTTVALVTGRTGGGDVALPVAQPTRTPAAADSAAERVERISESIRASLQAEVPAAGGLAKVVNAVTRTVGDRGRVFSVNTGDDAVSALVVVAPVGVSRAIKVPDPREPATACFLFTRAAGASVFVRTRLPGCEMALAL
jgi:hypothetical protein